MSSTVSQCKELLKKTNYKVAQQDNMIIAPDLRVLLAVLVPQLRLHFLVATCSLAVVPSVILSHHWLFGGGFVFTSFSESICGRLRLRGSFLASLQHHYSALRPS